MNSRRAAGRIAPALILIAALGIGCSSGDNRERDAAAQGGLPAGYRAALDRANRDLTDFVVLPTSTGLHVKTGPSGILFRASDRVDSGEYAVSGVFTQVSAPRGHREGFGLFVGGANLDGPAQAYTYFLVRGDGRYLISARSGATIRSLSSEWVPSDAVVVAGDADTTNALSIRVTDALVGFHCNGVQVAELDRDGLAVHGVAGIRVNHNLDVRMDTFRIERSADAQGAVGVGRAVPVGAK